MPFGNAHTIHAREHHMGWNPANTPVRTVAPGDTVEFDCIDSSGGQITENTVSNDLTSVDWTHFAPLTGPVAVDGAKPGDALKITIESFQPSGWGWSAITSIFGILNDQFLEPFLKIWHYDKLGIQPVAYADIARVPLKPFPGIIGLAPGVEGAHPALPPYPTGGNLDLRDLAAGTILYLPVETDGGLLSLGDTHATQGNGELAGTALESPMSVALRLELEKDYPLGGPRFITPGPVVRHLDGSGYYGTCGVGPDLREAARMATTEMIDHLAREHGLAPVDAYLLCSVCGDLVISEMVNAPVNVVSLYFPRCVLE